MSDTLPDAPAPFAAQASSTTSQVYDAIRDRILKGLLRPGAKLKIDALRGELGVGATPIREALSLLTSEELVERQDQRGFRVVGASEAHFRDILRNRCWLEERALRESIAGGDSAWEEALVLAHHRLARAKRDDDAAELLWEELHKRFHMALISAAGSPILLRFCAQLYDQNVRYRHLVARSASYSRRDVAAEHAQIADAALDRDADRAAALLLAHYQRTGKFVGEALD